MCFEIGFRRSRGGTAGLSSSVFAGFFHALLDKPAVPPAYPTSLTPLFYVRLGDFRQEPRRVIVAAFGVGGVEVSQEPGVGPGADRGSQLVRLAAKISWRKTGE